ncbi:hypothetical protein HZC31_06200 [Candidatus Woesearchaeota archaeon]|nr:hypothetical protein [Candidatus Woesearchaeota archaeon]
MNIFIHTEAAKEHLSIAERLDTQLAGENGQKYETVKKLAKLVVEEL